MNEQDKQLLLKDLSARLPYGVKVYCEDFSRCEFLTIRNISCYEIHFEEQGGQFSYISKIKPYLRPMSSMTEEEENEWWKFADKNTIVETHSYSIDWLTAHHFDYRGLIEKGLALAAPEGMYNLNE